MIRPKLHARAYRDGERGLCRYVIAWMRNGEPSWSDGNGQFRVRTHKRDSRGA